MRKILIIFKAIILTSSIAILPNTCTKTQDNKVDISHINISTTSINVNIHQDIYDNALTKFKKQVLKKITGLVSKEQKPQYGRDYKIIIANHDLYSKIEQYEQIDVTVQAAITTHILTGQFTSQINLVKPAKDISNINIPKQTYTNTIFGTNMFKDTIVNLSSIVQKQIRNIDNSAKQNIDYVINVEGHYLSEIVTKPCDVDINVTAVHDKYHFLLCGAFNFKLIIS